MKRISSGNKLEKQIRGIFGNRVKVSISQSYLIPGVPEGAWDLDVPDRYLVEAVVNGEIRYLTQRYVHCPFCQITTEYALELLKDKSG